MKKIILIFLSAILVTAAPAPASTKYTNAQILTIIKKAHAQIKAQAEELDAAYDEQDKVEAARVKVQATVDHDNAKIAEDAKTIHGYTLENIIVSFALAAMVVVFILYAMGISEISAILAAVAGVAVYALVYNIHNLI